MQACIFWGDGFRRGRSLGGGNARGCKWGHGGIHHVVEMAVRFEHYEVLEKPDGMPWELGRGAMGITYKAVDTNLHSPVALKVISGAHLQSATARERFLREARSAAALRHPNVASVYHLGTEGDTTYYAMEFIDGETVEDFLKREGAVAPRVALEIAAQVCRALAAADKHGLIHRDIKPANLMLVRDEEEEMLVKVIDFGLAKAVNAGGGDATLTIGGFLGTPHFASPEQLEEKDLDIRSDLYSLGATLWYMLAGSTPFSGSLAQVMSQHLNAPPPFGSLPDLPRPVVDLLGRLLAKDPAARPPSPQTARDEILACATMLDAAPADATATPSCPAADTAAETVSLEPATADPEAAATLTEFETAVMDETPVSLEPPDFSVGSHVAGRYEILAGEGPWDSGRRFLARQEDGTQVCLLVPAPGVFPSSESLTALESAVGILAGMRVPALLGVYSFESVAGTCFLVTERVMGESLLDAQRAAGVMPLGGALGILRPLAEGLDALESAGLPCPALVSHEILLVSDPATGGVVPKFLPLQLAAGAPVDAGATMVATARVPGRGAAGSAAFVCASLAYDMLGGMRNAAGAVVPVAALSEEGNAAIRRALDASGPPASTALEFVEILEADAPAHSTVAKTDAHAGPPDTQPAAPEAPRRFPRKALLAVAGAAVVLGGGTWILLRPGPPAPPPVEPEAPPVVERETAASFLERAGQAADPPAALAVFAGGLKEYPGDESLQAGAIEAVRGFLEADPAPESIVALLPVLGSLPLEAADEYELGRRLLDTDPEAGFELLHKAAGKDHPAATLLVAECHQRGRGTPRDDRAHIDLLRKAADLGDPRALNKLGDLTKKGIPGIINPDDAAAFKLFQRATDLGSLDAQGNLGALIHEGLGTNEPPNPAKAAALFKDGAEKGNALCMFFYSRCLEDGSGVEADPEAAREWLVRAAAMGLPPAVARCRAEGIPFDG
jgi:serine/threonine protein kinase